MVDEMKYLLKHHVFSVYRCWWSSILSEARREKLNPKAQPYYILLKERDSNVNILLYLAYIILLDLRRCRLLIRLILWSVTICPGVRSNARVGMICVSFPLKYGHEIITSVDTPFMFCSTTDVLLYFPETTLPSSTSLHTPLNSLLSQTPGIKCPTISLEKPTNQHRTLTLYPEKAEQH
jgi:hypothetical protein